MEFVLYLGWELIMSISVNRIISCQDLLDLKPDEFNPCSVIISDGLPIDIVLDSDIYIHEAYDFIVVGDKDRFIKHIYETKLKAYCLDGVIRERQIKPIIKQLEKIVRVLSYEDIQGNEEDLERCNYDDEFMLQLELRISMDDFYKFKLELACEEAEFQPNWASTTIYSRAGYTVRKGVPASKRLAVLFQLSDLFDRNISRNFESYCWYIKTFKSHSKCSYAIERRRRDLEALRYYEAHDGLIKYTEDFGRNLD